MPAKDSDAKLDTAADDVPRDKHRRSKLDKKSDREKDRVRDKDQHRHRSSKTSSARGSKLGLDGSDASARGHHRRDRDRDRDKDRDRDRDIGKGKTASTSDLNLDVSAPTLSLDSRRISLPYPTFSKAHSKEAIVSREDLGARKQSTALSPEHTNVPDDETGNQNSSSASKKPARASGPPTPPQTDVGADAGNKASDGKRDFESGPRLKSTSRSESAPRNNDWSKLSKRSASSSQATYVRTQEHKSHDKLGHTKSVRSSSSRHSVKRSNSTRSSSRRTVTEARDGGSSSSSIQDSSPRTPTQSARFPSQSPYEDTKEKSFPSLNGHGLTFAAPPTATSTSLPEESPVPPPPPPPPPVDIHDTPRVDYLLQNGGLPCSVSRRFLSVLLPLQNVSRPPNPPSTGADTLFAPFSTLLDQYSNVLAKQGSIAVATGHRSVARRLLDRLENVFSRDLPPHGCSCVMCGQSHEIHQGLTWGDVLEWVSGRIELPPWPPFDLAEIGAKAAEISAGAPPRPASPVKMDPDIAEEFREHYLRQSKKVRSAVDKWLNNTGENPVPPPQEVDDETLAFAILTNMDARDRPFFNALLSGTRDLKSAATRAPTPAHRPRSDFIIKSGLSLQRLYRLQQAPRDAESVSFLVKNPHTHDLLVTISNMNNSEWEILTSGRFDGFLWSGADADEATSGLGPTRGETPLGHRSPTSPLPRGASAAASSRNTTPFSPYSRNATPASFVSLTSSSGTQSANRQPVSNDEEMEIAAIAEIEREIFAGMETLEDAFEKLHQKAELVRAALRQRGAGLMQNLQSRRRIDVLPTPGSGSSSHQPGYERTAWGVACSSDDAEGGSDGNDDDWGLDDLDIMPDDSASNISSSRHRRPKRRTERRTPAPIEEDDEE